MTRLRPGALRDLPALAEIERETVTLFPPGTLPGGLDQPVAPQRLASAIAAGWLWVAEAPGVGAVGFAFARRVGAGLHLEEMDVRPSFGRRGIGTRLLLQACAAAARDGAAWVSLTTFAHLPWNAPFYARRGFVVADDLRPFPHLAAALREERERGLAHRIATVRPGGPAGR